MQQQYCQPITVRLIEPHPLARNYLLSLLGKCPDLEVLPDCDPSAMGREDAGPAVVFVIDAGTLESRLSDILRTIHRDWLSASAIILNKQISIQKVLDILFLGAVGFVEYSCVNRDLPEAVRSVAGGNAWIESKILRRFRDETSALRLAQRRTAATFTEREAIIIGLIERGLSNKEISSILGISESTVKFHLANVFNKAGVHNRMMVVNWVKANKVLTSSQSE